MSVSSVTSAFANYAQQVTSGSPSPNTVAGAAQEASESPAQTVKEAQNGDPVARKKLAKQAAQQEQQQQAASSQPAAPEPGKGKVVDTAA